MRSKIVILLIILFAVPSILFSIQSREFFPFVQIPFDLKSGYIVFSVPKEPSGYVSLLFDTGCQTTTLREDVLSDVDQIKGITLILGERTLEINDYHVTSKSLRHDIDGVIGNDLLHRYMVEIDFKRRVLSLFDSGQHVNYPECETVGIEVNALVSSVPLTITFPEGLQIKGEFMIDTGAPINVLINSPAAEINGLYPILETKKERQFKTLADTQSAVSVLARTVRIGRFESHNLEIFIATSKKGLFAGSKYAGIVGNQFLQNFRIMFDYKRKSLYIKKS